MLHLFEMALKRAFRRCMGWGGGVGDHIFEKIGRNHHKFRSVGQYEQTWQVDGGGSLMRNTNRPTCPTNRMLGKHIRSLGMHWMAFRELYKSPTA